MRPLGRRWKDTQRQGDQSGKYCSNFTTCGLEMENRINERKQNLKNNSKSHSSGVKGGSFLIVSLVDPHSILLSPAPSCCSAYWGITSAPVMSLKLLHAWRSQVSSDFLTWSKLSSTLCLTRLPVWCTDPGDWPTSTPSPRSERLTPCLNLPHSSLSTC